MSEGRKRRAHCYSLLSLNFAFSLPFSLSLFFLFSFLTVRVIPSLPSHPPAIHAFSSPNPIRPLPAARADKREKSRERGGRRGGGESAQIHLITSLSSLHAFVFPFCDIMRHRQPLILQPLRQYGILLSLQLSSNLGVTKRLTTTTTTTQHNTHCNERVERGETRRSVSSFSYL